MKKIKFPLVVMALLIAVAGAFAGNQKNATAKKGDVTYRYISDSDVLGDMQNIANWEVASSSCGLSGSIPCAFTYDGDFEQHLHDFETAYDLKQAADTRRTP
jgi:hypothetical protein